MLQVGTIRPLSDLRNVEPGRARVHRRSAGGGI